MGNGQKKMPGALTLPLSHQSLCRGTRTRSRQRGRPGSKGGREGGRKRYKSYGAARGPYDPSVKERPPRVDTTRQGASRRPVLKESRPFPRQLRHIAQGRPWAASVWGRTAVRANRRRLARDQRLLDGRRPKDLGAEGRIQTQSRPCHVKGRHSCCPDATAAKAPSVQDSSTTSVASSASLSPWVLLQKAGDDESVPPPNHR